MPTSIFRPTSRWTEGDGDALQGDRDIVVALDMRALPLDPSLEGQRMTAKTGSMTWPFGPSDRIETRAPAPPNWQTQRFETVQAALEDGVRNTSVS